VHGGESQGHQGTEVCNNRSCSWHEIAADHCAVARHLFHALPSKKFGSQVVTLMCPFSGFGVTYIVGLLFLGRGGGNKENIDLALGDVPTLWMANEAMIAGLKLTPSQIEWEWEHLKKYPPEKSLAGWQWLEYLPFRRLSYEDRNSTTR
jgi:hypothetical protein